MCIQRKLAQPDNSEMDSLMDLVEEIQTHVESTRLFGDAVWVASENLPVFSQEHLANGRTFTSVLTFTFRKVG